jgi:hypothetical protein
LAQVELLDRKVPLAKPELGAGLSVATRYLEVSQPLVVVAAPVVEVLVAPVAAEAVAMGAEDLVLPGKATKALMAEVALGEGEQAQPRQIFLEIPAVAVALGYLTA